MSSTDRSGSKGRIAIVGGGPAGSSTAIRLAGAGYSSTLIEKESFPRFHIGESLTGESGNLLREMGFDAAMSEMANPVKHAVRIYSPSGRDWFWFPVKRRTDGGQLEEATTWQVRRSTFDAMLLDRARSLGTRVVPGRAAAPLFDSAGGVRGVRCTSATGDIEIGSDVLVDCSGQQTFLANAGVTGRKERGAYDRQVALYGHFTGVLRDDGDAQGNTVLFFKRQSVWAWSIPVDEEVTSIGLVVTADYFQGEQENRRDFLLRELGQFNKELTRRTRDAELVGEVRASSNYSYEVNRFVGPGWLCVGDAHRFLDPLFSFGVNIALAEAREASRAIVEYLEAGGGERIEPLERYARWSRSGLDVCQTVLDGFTKAPFAFGTIMAQHENDFIDLLAGRVWNEPDYPSLAALRDALTAADERAGAESRQG